MPAPAGAPPPRRRPSGARPPGRPVPAPGLCIHHAEPG